MYRAKLYEEDVKRVNWHQLNITLQTLQKKHYKKRRLTKVERDKKKQELQEKKLYNKGYYNKNKA